MELTGEALIDAPRDEVWQGLMNTDLLRVSIPGCESVTDEGEGAYSAAVLASVGPVRAKFKGKLFQQSRVAHQVGRLMLLQPPQLVGTAAGRVELHLVAGMKELPGVHPGRAADGIAVKVQRPARAAV